MKTFMISMVAIAAATFVRPAQAEVEFFNVVWSGAPHGNLASGYATIGIDTATIPNPAALHTPASLPPWLSSITLTITGATAGNGTFTLADFGGVSWHTNGATLNLDAELVGQPTNDLPWGTPAAFNGGDFNLFDATGGAAAPNGVLFFDLATNSGAGDVMRLVSFAPVPEPSTYALLSLGCFGFLALRRRRSRS